ncbi:threonine dehydrogenase-like Zn-dependent dehydrogenase [Ureibacillus chungkukjangi]|uniref:Threonine dehydrogenase-like Zn-dependent dehydrogenase n=2 Tax=Ureibacillus chungkukjangi TaxID=1202712 RepID=A0A318TJZ4_9BACL|nr:threonine dehydrogenase-like Zn-dependent dehydrogenase [Ureibacillus chungkukjangi]
MNESKSEKGMATMEIPKLSRAAVLRNFGEKLQIENVEIPQTIEPRAVLVKNQMSSICGTDVHLWQGELNLKVNLPVILGHEMVGEIVKLGEEVSVDSIGNPLKEGDRVIWSHADCGNCYYCNVEKQPTLCLNRRSYMYETMEKYPYLMGGFSEYGYILPTSGRVKVPDTVSSELASLCSCAFRSVMNSFNQLGSISSEDIVVVQGTGPLGLLAICVAKKAGAKSVIAIGGPEERLSLAEEMGADIIINISIEKTMESRNAIINNLTNGLGADIVLEYSGHPSAFEEGLNYIRKNGRYVVVGQLGTGKVEIMPSLITAKNLKLIGSFSGGIGNYYQALKFIEKYQYEVPFNKMITNIYYLEEINEALESMKDFKEIKPIIKLA